MKTLRHLELNPTFEKLIQTGETYDFPNIHIPDREAINFRNSWGGQLDPVGTIIDEHHDDRVEKILATMKGFLDQQDARREQKKEEHRQMFAENIPTGNTEAEHVHPEAEQVHPGATSSAPPPSHWGIGPLGAAGSAPTFTERMQQRQNTFKEANTFEYRKHINRARQEARQAADRNRELNHKRNAPPQFDISTPPSSPHADPNNKMEDKYNKRMTKTMAKRNPKVEMQPAPTRPKGELLQKKRESALQIDKKRPRAEREVFDRNRKRKVN